MNYSEVINSAPVVLVEFSATWCPHCQRMRPVVAEVKKLLEGKAVVAEYDIDQCGPLDEQNGVESVPTFILYRHGREVWRHTGELALSGILERVDHALMRNPAHV